MARKGKARQVANVSAKLRIGDAEYDAAKSEALIEEPPEIYPPMNSNRAGKRVYSAEESREQLAKVEGAFLTGYSLAQTARRLASKLGVSKRRVAFLYERVVVDYQRVDETIKEQRREAARRRMHLGMSKAASAYERATTVAEEMNVSRTVLAWEVALARIEGTEAPVRVEVDAQVQQSVVMALAQMSEEERHRIADEIERDSEAARAYEAMVAAGKAPQLPPH